MWPWTEQKPNPDSERVGAALTAIERRLRDIEQRLPEIEAMQSKRIDDLEIEWTEWYDKYRRLYARIAKRQQREEPEVAPEAPNGDEPRLNPLAARLLRGSGT